MLSSVIPRWALPILAVISVAVASVADAADTRERNGLAFNEAIKDVNRGHWDDARAHAAEISDPVALVAVEWMRLRDGSDDWGDYLAFLENHGDWPGLKLLRKTGEASIGSQHRPKQIVEYFADQPPQTGHGAVRYAVALNKLGRRVEAREAIRDAWLNLPFDEEAEAEALRRFSGRLKNLHEDRLDHLLWNGRTEEAERMLPLVSASQKRLARARIALRNVDSGVDALIANVPQRLRSDP